MEITIGAVLRWVLTIVLLCVVSRHAHWSVTLFLILAAVALELQTHVDALLVKALRTLVGKF